MKVLIGDSYAIGEYRCVSQSLYRNSPGFYPLLCDKFKEVINLTSGGSSNLSNIESLKLLCSSLPISEIIFFYTDPIRDLNNFDIIKSEDKFNKWYSTYLKKVFFELSKLSSKIHVVAGCVNLSEKLTSKIVKDLSSINIVSYSIKSWLDHKYDLSNFYIGYDCLEKIHYNTVDKQLLNLMIRDFEYMSSSSLYPDGRHYSQECFEKIGNLLIDILDVDISK